jgi:hypothetical protein
VLIPLSGAPLLGIVALFGAVGVVPVAGGATVVVPVAVGGFAFPCAGVEVSSSEPQAASASAATKAVIARIRLMPQ